MTGLKKTLMTTCILLLTSKLGEYPGYEYRIRSKGRTKFPPYVHVRTRTRIT